MNEHDEGLLESVALLALGVLGDEAARQARAHLATCETCRREYAELRPVADAVGLSGEAAPGEIPELQSARMKARLMRVVRSEGSAFPDASTTAVSGGDRFRRQPWLAWAAAAAAIVLALLSTLNNYALRSENDADKSAIAQLQARVATQARLADANKSAIAQLQARVAQQARLADVLASGTRFPVAGGQVIRSGNTLVIALGHLPAPPKGKVYQAWTLAPGAKAVAPSITFQPDAAGNAVVTLPEAAARVAAVAVSVEPAGGSKAPTSKPNFVRKLS